MLCENFSHILHCNLPVFLQNLPRRSCYSKELQTTVPCPWWFIHDPVELLQFCQVNKLYYFQMSFSFHHVLAAATCIFSVRIITNLERYRQWSFFYLLGVKNLP